MVKYYGLIFTPSPILTHPQFTYQCASDCMVIKCKVAITCVPKSCYWLGGHSL